MTTATKPGAPFQGPSWAEVISDPSKLGIEHQPGRSDKKYSPDQPRDERGRFGESGGSSPTTAATVVPGVPDLVSQGWVAGIAFHDVRDAMTHYVATAGVPAPELYRGMHNNPDTERFAEQVQNAIGSEIQMKASSFSEDKAVANQFAASDRETAYMAGSVVITVTPGAQAIDVQPASRGYAGDLFAYQKEWVTAGTFHIDSADRSDAGVLHVHLTQMAVPE